jgi:hypothetical protein
MSVHYIKNSYIYVEDSSLSVVVPSSLAIDSQLSFRTSGIINLAIKCKNPEDKIFNINAAGISNHTQHLLSDYATTLTMTFMATPSIVP